jgi:hypothetical protein
VLALLVLLRRYGSVRRERSVTAPVDEGSYVVVIGTDGPGAAAKIDEVIRFRDTYTQVRLPRLVTETAGSLRASLYELVVPDERGDLGPRWIVWIELGGPGAAATYTASRQPTVDTRWEIIWRRRDGYAGTIGRWARPYLYLIGMNPATGSSTADLAAFDDFYDRKHVPEVVAVLGYDQALRFELVRSLAHDGSECPRFMATYSGDEEIVRRLARGIPAGAIDLKGPPAWNKRDTRWRLIYRQVGSYATGVSA